MKIEHADTLFKRLRGLMFRRRAAFRRALVFEFDRETRVGACIHSFFVFFDFDAVWLDSRHRVVDARRVRPCSIVAPRKSAKYLIELPAGAIKTRRIRIGRKFNLN